MRQIIFVLCVLFFVFTKAHGQDILYTTSGTKIKGKVTEINSKDIKYKDFSNLDGPTYVIAKTDIVLIQYADGNVDVINDNPTTLVPKITETEAPFTAKSDDRVTAFDKNDPYAKGEKGLKKDFDLHYLNTNMLSINALALANGDVTIMYDRDLYNSRMSLTFLGGYSFNPYMGGLNLLIADSKDRARKKYDAGFGINFMPRNTKRVQYFAGLMAKYMAYEYMAVIDTMNNQNKYEKANAYQLGIMASTGWIFRVSPNFNLKLFGAIGGSINSSPLREEYAGVPKVYLGYCFGYRF